VDSWIAREASFASVSLERFLSLFDLGPSPGPIIGVAA